MVSVYGIRHHGPGSARSLVKALREMEPDCILLEMPADAAAAMPYIASGQLTAPVALLIYNPQELSRASYYPFASFSPEWQACQYAYSRSVPVVPMDLPVSIQLRLREEQQQFQFSTDEEHQLQRDPLGYLAALGGYTDGERWWELHFEQSDHESKIFDTVLELVTTLRDGLQRQESKETLLREAHMRKIIRKTCKEGYQRIAIVCGAWHAPVLHRWQSFTVKQDNARLKGLKKVKTQASWVPWSYDRLAVSSGYAAGVVSPAWYEMLFSKRKEVVTRWMVKVGRLLRAEDLDGSPAHAVEAVRLAESLAMLRQLEIPGLRELEEAAIAVFGAGKESTLALIRQKLVIGHKVGKIGTGVPQIPLFKDLQKQIKSARLTKEWNATETKRKDLDLRKPTNLAASHLIRRLGILNISWGTLRKGSQFRTGSFSEHWTLRKRTDYTVKLIAGGTWGNTVQEAAMAFAKHRGEKAVDLSEVASLTDDVLKADLPRAVPTLIQKLRNLAALTVDIAELMRAVPQFVQIIRYGNTRKTDVAAVAQLLDSIFPRIFVGLPNACNQIDDHIAGERFQQLIRIQQSIAVLDRADYREEWHRTLQNLQGIEAVHPLVKGLVVRLLFDKGMLGLQAASKSLHMALSTAREDNYKAAWLEGFLSGSGLLLIHNPELWSVIDGWIGQLDMDRFYLILPLLRRTFSIFSEAERRRILTIARQEKPETTATPGSTEEPPPIDEALAETVRSLLGI